MFVPGRRISGGAVIILGICLIGAVSTSATAVDIIGVWDGAIIVKGTELGVTIEFARGDSGLTGDIDIPAQKEKDLPLTNIKLDSSKITFDFPGSRSVRRWPSTSIRPSGVSRAITAST